MQNNKKKIAIMLELILCNKWFDNFKIHMMQNQKTNIL